jgi:hypothetical protein
MIPPFLSDKINYNKNIKSFNFFKRQMINRNIKKITNLRRNGVYRFG